MNTLTTFFTHYYQLQFDSVEFAAVLSVLVWNAVERYDPLTPAMQAKRDQVYT